MNREDILLSLWNKAGASNPNTSSPWTYKRPTVVSSENQNLRALLVGINHYHSETLKPLQGAVADALAFKEHLEVDLGTPKDNIRTLLNGSATRAAIIGALDSFKTESRLSKGDPVLIFYAGYGGEVVSSDSSRTRERCIVPYDYLQRSSGCEVEPINLSSLNKLVLEIVETKGDNITVILDCSFAPSKEIAHESPYIRVRSAQLKSLSPSNSTAENVLETSDERLPYMLFTACSYFEVAREEYGRGNFSKAILNLLRHSSPHELVYSEMLSRIDQIPGQTPQSVGRNNLRNLFDSKIAVTHRTCFHLSKADGKFILHAGTINGIASGAEFTIYSSDDHSFAKPYGVMGIDSLEAFSTTLIPPANSDASVFPESALALQTKLGKMEDVRFYIPIDDRFLPCYQAVIDLIRGGRAELENIFLVDSPHNAHIEIAEENGKAIFLLRDERITQYGLNRLFESVELSVEGIIPVLRAAAHYYWKINRTNADPEISTKVQVEFYRLDDPAPDSFIDSELVPIGPNLYHNNMVEFVVEEDCPYGLNLINNGPHDLYPYMFYFDNSDLSIGSYYQPPQNGRGLPPLKRDGGTLSIGYGNGGAVPFAYFLRDRQDLDVGFLKIFLSTKPVDLSSMPQTSPFETTRGAESFAKSTIDTWSMLLIPVIQHRYPPNAKPCPKCGHINSDDTAADIFSLQALTEEMKGERDILAQRLAQQERLFREQLQSLQNQAPSMKEITDMHANVPHPHPKRRSTSEILKDYLSSSKKRFWLW